MRNNIFCDYQSAGKTKNQFVCGLGLYGGVPYIGNCINCVDKKQNNQNYANELIAKHNRTHPEKSNKISGCCDSARNYIDR